MIFRIIALIVLCSFFSLTGLCQQNFTLSGTIKDGKDGEQLVGASVVVKGTSHGAVTNIYGFYSLTLPAGEYRINVTYIGYKLFEKEVNLDSDIQLAIELIENSEELEGVVVKHTQSKTKTTEIALSKLTTEAIRDIPAILGEADLQQAMISLPGITSASEISNGFNVRGGKVDHNLILVDEAPVFNSTHLFGLISVVNPDAIKKVNVYKAGIPAKFGGRASSVVDIQLNSGNNKQFELTGGIGPLSSRLGIEVPIVKDKINFYVSGRRSFIDVILPLMGNPFIPSISFFDLTSKITYHHNSNNTLYLSGYFGRDKLSLSEAYMEDGENVEANSSFVWGNVTGTLRWNHIFSPKWFSNLTLLRGQYEFSFESDSEDFFSTEEGEGGKYRNGINNTGLKYDLNHFMSEKIGVNLGIGATQYEYIIGGKQSSRINDNKYNINYFGYVDLDYRPIKKLNSRIGLRYSGAWVFGPDIIFNYDPDLSPSPHTVVSTRRIKANETVARFSNFEPRISANYEIYNNSSIKIAYDRMVQYSHLLSNSKNSLPFESWTTVNNSFKPTVTDQLSMGGIYNFNSFEIEVGVFYKSMNNLLQFKSNSDLFLDDFIETKVLPAKGESNGIEFSLSKNAGKLKGFLNYTYSQTKIKSISKFDLIQINNGDWFFADYDRPHVIAFNIRWDLSKRIQLTTHWNFASGTPYTSATGKIMSLLTYSKKNAYRLPNSHRLDFAMSINPNLKKKKKRWSGYWTISIINLYKRKNIFAIFPATNDSGWKNTEGYSLVEGSIFGTIIPSFTYNFKFN